MRKPTLAVLLLCMAAAVTLYLAPLPTEAAPPATPMTGTWHCMAHGGQQGDVAFTLTLKQDGENVSGHVSSSIGDADLNSGTFKAHHLHITINGEDNTYTLEADYKSGKLSGTWALGGTQEKGTWEGKKAAKP